MKRTLLRSVLLFSFIAFPFSTFSQKAGSFADSRDGRTYKTVKIGDQWWMAENLNYKTASGSWAYEDKESYAAVYGRLYDWETATKVCPSGWHLPGDKEWKALTDFLGGEDAAGGKLKEAGTAHWREPNTGANNESGFSALPGGSFLGMGMFFTLRDYGYWWSSTESSSDTAWYRNLTAEKSLVERNDSYKELGMSVRCIQDR